MGVDPAYAGMNLVVAKLGSLPRGGPRVCGDEPVVRGMTENALEWTPRMRG